MKSVLILALLVCLTVPARATYYEITSGYDPGLTLHDSDSLLMTGGGLGDLNLRSNSTAAIKGTSTLSQGSGGIWGIGLWDTSNLNMSGGEVHEIGIHNDATAILAGGMIESIYSYQVVWEWDYGVDPPEQIPNPHIALYHSGDVPTVQEIGGFDYLVGNWGDGTGFSIYLHDTGYDAYGNFDFIPEPATLTLLGLGVFLIRRKK